MNFDPIDLAEEYGDNIQAVESAIEELVIMCQQQPYNNDAKDALLELQEYLLEIQ